MIPRAGVEVRDRFERFHDSRIVELDRDVGIVTITVVTDVTAIAPTHRTIDLCYVDTTVCHLFDARSNSFKLVIRNPALDRECMIRCCKDERRLFLLGFDRQELLACKDELLVLGFDRIDLRCEGFDVPCKRIAPCAEVYLKRVRCAGYVRCPHLTELALSQEVRDLCSVCNRNE